MKALICYQDIQSGAKIATASIVTWYKRNYPKDKLIIYKQSAYKFSGSFSFFRNTIWSVANFWWILLQLESVDCIYTSTYTLPLAWSFSNKRHIPCIFHIHGDQRIDPDGNENFFPKTIYTKIISQMVLAIQAASVRYATIVCFVSKISQDHFFKKYNLLKYSYKARCVPNGVDSQKFFPISQAQKMGLRKKMGIPEGKLLLFVGRMDPKKGIRLLLHALPHLQNTPAATVIAYPAYFDKYSKRYYAQLRKEAAKLKRSTVIFIKNHFNIANLYQIADCVVLPSSQEMAPLVVLEALASGTPIITSNIGNAKDVLSPIKKYTLLDNLTPKTIAKKIDQILTLPYSQKKWLTHEGVLIASSLSWKKSAEKLHELFLLATQPQ